MGNTQSADDGDGGSEHASYGDSVFFGSYSSPNRALPPSDSSSSSKKEGGQQRVEQRASSPPITTPDPPADESSLDHVKFPSVQKNRTRIRTSSKIQYLDSLH